MGRAKGQPHAVATDRFSDVLGVHRGRKLTLQSIVLDPNEDVRTEEMTRLMNLAVAKDFSEPLRVLHACAEFITSDEDERTTTPADVLNMTVATQMYELNISGVMNVAEALGKYDESAYDNCHRTWFATGLGSRMGAVLEKQLAFDCPPDNWEPWLREAWQREFPAILAERCRETPDQILNSLFSSDTIGGRYLQAVKDAGAQLIDWDAFAHQALYFQPQEGERQNILDGSQFSFTNEGPFQSNRGDRARWRLAQWLKDNTPGFAFGPLN